jgi:hypothetical protein
MRPGYIAAAAAAAAAKTTTLRTQQYAGIDILQPSRPSHSRTAWPIPYAASPARISERVIL